jgi:nucleoid DNA-binding protein
MDHIDLARDVAERLGVPRKDAKEIIFLMVCAMSEGLAVDGILDIANFGAISVRDRPSRVHHHVHFREFRVARDTVEFRFRPYKKLQEAVESEPLDEEF